MRYIIIVDDTEFYKTDNLPSEEELKSGILVIDTKNMSISNVNGMWEDIVNNWDD